MRLWLIPLIYVAASAAGGLIVPRIEQAYLPAHTLGISVASAQAYLSAAASGMMALTAIVFAMAFVMVQFSAIAYSPRLVLWLARDRVLFHALGIFVATFIYALCALAWVDRGGSGAVPLASALIVGVLLLVSMLLFSWLVQRLGNLQITNVLHLIGDRGRAVIRDMFEREGTLPSSATAAAVTAPATPRAGAVTQSLTYSGEPRAIAKLDVDALVRHAQQADAVLVLKCAVGDTLVKGTALLEVRGGNNPLSESSLMRAIHLAKERTFEQDPKYPIRLLVDIAIKALSPAINDPTTAVQTIDQIEDLLHRLGACAFDAGYARDASGAVRVIIPMPTWEDYLALAFDEIRQYGATSVQVMRRLRAALVALANALADGRRAEAVRQYLTHLAAAIERSPLDAEDRLVAGQEDRQGLGLSRKITSTS